MRFLKKLIGIDENAQTPKYLQIADAFILNIRNGKLRKGLKLPGSRKMASMLNINRMTMVAAYDELQAQGWVKKIPRKGTFVREELPILNPRAIEEGDEVFTMPDNPSYPIDKERIVVIPYSEVPDNSRLVFNDGFPDPRLAPVEKLTREMRRISKLSSYRKFRMYGGSQGNKHLRETLATRLSDSRGLPLKSDNILVTRGARTARYVASGRGVSKPKASTEDMENCTCDEILHNQ